MGILRITGGPICAAPRDRRAVRTDAFLATTHADSRGCGEMGRAGALLFTRIGAGITSEFFPRHRPRTPLMRRRRAGCSANLPGRSRHRVSWARDGIILTRGQALGALWDLAGSGKDIPAVTDT